MSFFEKHSWNGTNVHSSRQDRRQFEATAGVNAIAGKYYVVDEVRKEDSSYERTLAPKGAPPTHLPESVRTKLFVVHRWCGTYVKRSGVCGVSLSLRRRRNLQVHILS